MTRSRFWQSSESIARSADRRSTPVTIRDMWGALRCCCLVVSIVVPACGTGDNQIDPGALELRDLLGVAPETAATWSDSQRQSARDALAGALAEAGPPEQAAFAPGASLDERLATTLAELDLVRTNHNEDSLAAVTL